MQYEQKPVGGDHGRYLKLPAVTPAGYPNYYQSLTFLAHLDRQKVFRIRAFGPSARTEGVLDHIRLECNEVSGTGGKDLSEWIDIAMLAFSGALGAGFAPYEIVQAIEAKQTKNEKRSWPDWRTADENKAICHVKGIHD